MQPEFSIGEKSIGRGHPVFIVAEISANHVGDYDIAVETLKTAQEAGADAVKVQTYSPDTLTIDCDLEQFRIKGTIWEGRNLFQLYSEAYMPWEWQPKLKEAADELGIIFFSSAFDETSVDFLEEIGVPAYKVASFEIVDVRLLRKIAATGKPVILSTGMASLAEIQEAVSIFRDAGHRRVALLKCASAYPAPPETMNLLTITHMRETFGLPVGLSDHTLGLAVPVASVALGACIIEKHFTISRSLGGADAAFSLEPTEFKAMVEAVRDAEQAIGGIHYGPSEHELGSCAFRRSLFVVEDMKAGEPFSVANVRSIRPADGLHPRYLDIVLGRVAAVDIKRGTPLGWELVGGLSHAKHAKL
jgi:N-acetylneuraminate synthase